MPSSFVEKTNNLPPPVKAVLLSNQIAEDVYGITTSYGLKEDEQEKVAKLVGLVFVNDIALAKLKENLEKQIFLPEAIAAGIALNLTKKIFLSLKDYFRDAEMLIGYWSQKAAPPTQKPKSLGIKPLEPSGETSTSAPPSPVSASVPVKESFRLAIQENKEVLNQILTTAPIKIAEFEQPVRPTIKNWLADYIHEKGAGHHESLERSDYLYNSANARNLPENERNLLAEILKAYDDDTEMPVSPETKLLVLEELAKKEALPRPPVPPSPTAPPPTAPSPPPSLPTAKPSALPPAPPTPPDYQTPPQPPPGYQPPPQPPSYQPPPKKDVYREPIEKQDVAGPMKPPARPTPRLNGNIIDLKNINE